MVLHSYVDHLGGRTALLWHDSSWGKQMDILKNMNMWCTIAYKVAVTELYNKSTVFDVVYCNSSSINTAVLILLPFQIILKKTPLCSESWYFSMFGQWVCLSVKLRELMRCCRKGPVLCHKGAFSWGIVNGLNLHSDFLVKLVRTAAVTSTVRF